LARLAKPSELAEAAPFSLMPTRFQLACF